MHIVFSYSYICENNNKMSQLNLTINGVEAFSEAFKILIMELLALNTEASSEEIIESAARLFDGLSESSIESFTAIRNDANFQKYAEVFRSSLKTNSTDEDSEAAGV